MKMDEMNLSVVSLFGNEPITRRLLAGMATAQFFQALSISEVVALRWEGGAVDWQEPRVDSHSRIPVSKGCADKVRGELLESAV